MYLVVVLIGSAGEAASFWVVFGRIWNPEGQIYEQGLI